MDMCVFSSPHNTMILQKNLQMDHFSHAYLYLHAHPHICLTQLPSLSGYRAHSERQSHNLNDMQRSDLMRCDLIRNMVSDHEHD